MLDKKVGIVGFGRIGQLVAERMKGFGVEILAYDPYVSVQRAGQLGARLVTLDELLAESDFITIHLPKTPETIGLIGKEALTKVKPSVRIINAARGGVLDEEALADAIGEGRVAASVPVQLDGDVRGEITSHDVSIWELAALKGLFTDITEDPVTYVNAPLLAAERGCESRLLTDEVSEDFRNVTTLRGTLADGTVVSVAGTLTGPKMVQKIIGVNGFELEIPISQHLAFFSYVDRPGVIGAIGKLLGDAAVNIAGMQVSRDDDSGRALVALTLDSAIPEDVISALQSEIGEDTVRVVNLV